MVIFGVLFLRAWGREWKIMRYWRTLARQKETVQNWTGQDILPQYQSLYQANHDFVGWLSVDGTHVDFPIMQTKNDPEYYLWRDFDGEERNFGMPFVDYRCDVSPVRSFNTIIYGHNGIFTDLFNYASPNALYRVNPYIRFDTLTETGVYEVSAVFYANGKDARLLFPWDPEDEQAYEFYNYIEVDSIDGFRKYAEKIEQNRFYSTQAPLTADSHVLTLVSCAMRVSYDGDENWRFVVVAKQVQ